MTHGRSRNGVASTETDVIVIGAGVAGLCAAISASPRRVLVLCPDSPIRSSSSALAQGGIAAPLAANDSVALHVEDTLVAAGHAADRAIVERILARAGAAIEYLEGVGVAFDRDGAERSFHLEAGHSRARVLHAAGDRSGAAIVEALSVRAAESAHIDILHGWRAIELIGGPGGVAGARVADARGNQQIIRARDTVLATGGLGQLFARTTNGPEAHGDGLAMALAIGARTAALEFVQFHPTALAVESDPLPLLTEALRGAGAFLVTADGRRIMDGCHPHRDLAPRDIVARSVYECSHRGEQVFLDATPVFASDRGSDFPGARDTARRYGLDPATTPLPVSAAAHYHMGGVAVDERGRTSLPGLWACGEVACTGLHGANRLASNSLLEAVVCGRTVGEALAANSSARRRILRHLVAIDSLHDEAARYARVRQLMWSAMGPVRHGQRLVAAIRAIRRDIDETPPEERRARTRLQLCLAMTNAALLRTESRGAHWRLDFPERDSRRDGSLFSELGDARRAIV